MEALWPSKQPVSSFHPHLPVWNREDLRPTFCHWLRLWQSTVPKLNLVLFISQRLSAKCGGFSSLLTSFHRYDRFPDASFWPSFTHTSRCPHSFPISDNSHTKSLSHEQDQNQYTDMHTQRLSEMKALSNYHAVITSISVYSNKSKHSNLPYLFLFFLSIFFQLCILHNTNGNQFPIMQKTLGGSLFYFQTIQRRNTAWIKM